MSRRSLALSSAVATFLVGLGLAITGMRLLGGEHRRWAPWLILGGLALVPVSSWVSTKKGKDAKQTGTGTR